MWRERLMDLAGLMLVGEGLAALVRPRNHAGLWRGDLPGYSRMMDALVARPALRRVLAAAELGAGLMLIERAEQW